MRLDSQSVRPQVESALERRVETALGMTALALLLAGCFVVLWPFLTALLWALIMAVSTWPAYAWLEDRLHGRRAPAAALVTIGLAVVLVVPLVFAGAQLAENIGQVVGLVNRLLQQRPDAPPDWVAELPIIGNDVVETWTALADGSISIAGAAAPYVAPTGRWLLNRAAGLGTDVLLLSFSVVTTYFLYRYGTEGARRLEALLERLAGLRGKRLLRVTYETTIGVVYGIIGTAIAQGSLTALGLLVAGVPGALFLGIVASLLSIIPMGIALVIWPAAGWLVVEERYGWAIFMFVWGLFPVGTVDNFIRPYFISRGARLPLLLVFLGVVGGALAFGLLGLFIGPILLAVLYTLLIEWTDRAAAAGDPAAADRIAAE